MTGPDFTGAPNAARVLADAFPQAHRADAEIALCALPEAATSPRLPDAPVALDGEPLWIPSRIYNAEPATLALEALTPQRRLYLHCVLSRHSDGFVRERHAGAIVKSGALFAVPFIVELAADYVVQVVETIRHGLADLDTYPSRQFEMYGQFLYDNPDQFELVRQRTHSYWTEHHRHSISKDAYPGFALLDSFERAVDHQAKKPSNRRRLTGR